MEEFASGTVDLAEEINEAEVLLVGSAGFDQHGAGAVTEQDARGTVLVVDDTGHGVGANHHYVFVAAGPDQVRAGGEPVEKTGAGRDEVEAPGFRCADLVLDEAGGSREEHVRSDGADNDRVEFRDAGRPRSFSAAKAASTARSDVA